MTKYQLSTLESRFEEVYLKLGSFPLKRQHGFSNRTRHRLDYAVLINGDPDIIKLGIEIQGGTWSKERMGHSTGSGIHKDYIKHNLAASLGWQILYFDANMISPQFLRMIEVTAKRRMFNIGIG